MRTLKKVAWRASRYKFQLAGLIFSGYSSVCICIITFWPDSLGFEIKLSAAISLLLGIIFAIMAHCDMRSSRNFAILDKDDKDIPEYNAKFYSRTGRYVIYCHNFEWVTNEKPEVMPILIKKAKEGMDNNGNYALTVWVELAYINTANVKNLCEAGANVKIIPENKMDENLIFSVRIDGDRKECILRHKSEDTYNPDTIMVHKLISHAYMLLVEEFIESLEQVAESNIHG